MAKSTTIFDEAKRIQSALAAIDRREEIAQIALTVKFANMREAVAAGASDAALRVIEAARDCLGGASGK